MDCAAGSAATGDQIGFHFDLAHGDSGVEGYCSDGHVGTPTFSCNNGIVTQDGGTDCYGTISHWSGSFN